MRTLTVGQKVIAKNDRILEFADHEPLVIWKQGQVLTVCGIVQHEPGYLEALIDLGDRDWEGVPWPMLDELFDLPH